MKSAQDFMTAFGIVDTSLIDWDKDTGLGKDILDKLEKTSRKTINNRLSSWKGHPIQYTPLTMAIAYRRPDIAERFLKDFEDIINVDKISTHGGTALFEALCQYRQFRFTGKVDEETLSMQQRYRNLCFKLIEMTQKVSSFYAETEKNHRAVMQFAIDTYDLDIVKAIVEKDYDTSKINTADMETPLYYSINKLKVVSDIIHLGKIDDSVGNINWDKLNVPGISIDDKMASWLDAKNRLKEMISKHPEILEKINYQWAGSPIIREDEKIALEEIALYLIDATKDLDAFHTREGVNTLAYSIECDFPNIMKKLIDKGASIYCSEFNDTPVIRAVFFKAYDCLKVLLTDYRDKVRPIINVRFHDYGLTAAHHLFCETIGTQFKTLHIVNQDNYKTIKEFIRLFREAGADLNIPDDKGVRVQQLLDQYQITS
jgi:ankyrin repeat protein